MPNGNQANTPDRQAMLELLKKATREPTDRAVWIKQGFPEQVVAAFLATAEFTDSVVMTRVPGQATTQLIREAYDLKGFFIKAKSCDWGPMAGFLCRNPAFNKKGAGGIDANRKEHYTYKKKLQDKFQNPPGDAAFQQRAFLPIQLSDARKRQFLGEYADDPLYNFPPPLQVDKSRPDEIIGLASSSDRKPTDAAGSVVTEFLLLKFPQAGKTYWLLYHGNVYAKQANGAYAPYQAGDAYQATSDPDNANIKKAIEQAPTELVFFDNDQVAKLKSWLSPLGITRDNSTRCFTIDGLVNPYPINPNDPKDFRNTVTGDYDLFAVWPVLPPAGFDNLIRNTEMKPDEAVRNSEYPSYNQPAVSGHIALPAVGKSFTAELTRSRNVYVEFIPSPDLIGQLENAYYGNGNEAVLLVAGTLNSLLANRGYQPNKAFHSDEGGRPGVNEIEYPFAVFIPTRLASALRIGPYLLIEKHAEFLSLIELLRGKCYIPLNHGWMLHWFTLLQPDSALTGTDYLARRRAEKAALAQARTPVSNVSELAFLEERLRMLFLRLADLIVPETSRSHWTRLLRYLGWDAPSDQPFSEVKNLFWQMITNTDPNKTPQHWRDALLAIKD